jgi:phage virion morphogenesis protein
MTGASIQIQSNDAEIAKRLDAAGAVLSDLRPTMSAIGAAMLFSTQRRFETKTAPDGQPWRPLAPRTARERAKRGRSPNDILRDSTRLYQSLAYQVSGSGSVVAAEWGSNMPYAAVHQLGATIEMPERTQKIYQAYDAKNDIYDPRFRKKSKSNFERTVKVKAHRITIPARPYLGINDADREAIIEMVDATIAQATGGGR